ncbi:anhydro-N-acetylmuramic acid kinase [Pasteurellaceae bacterium Macca]|nr:anhydro-N-acetylmuramic acid kinase [Pasteurellaceae bacterium Macca]
MEKTMRSQPSSPTQLYLGMMSGTSLDGVDLALVDFAKSPPKMTACDCVPMPENLRQDLSQLLKSGETTLQHLGELDHRLGLLYADCVNQFLARLSLSSADIVAIGCHGQTVWHAPQGAYPFTSQIGDMHLLATKTEIPVVGDFRRKDMAVGGQGAPLVPAFHEAIFQQAECLIGVLNIGGISNISLLHPDKATLGYDIGAGNTLLDSWIEKHQGKRFDYNGEWGRSGRVDDALLALLLDEAYFRLPPPKSTGRELFNLAWLEGKLAHLARPIPAENVQATLVEFTARSIAENLQGVESPAHFAKRLLVCGGGAKNPLIMQRLTALLPDWQVLTTSDVGVDVDYVEALAFAWLAYRRWHYLPSNLPSVTGASQAVSLGVIFN